MTANRFISLLASIAIGMAWAATAAAEGGSKTVDCSLGQSLANAVKHAPAGATIYVKGFCDERIKIKRDRIKLVGIDHAPTRRPLHCGLQDIDEELTPGLAGRLRRRLLPWTA